MAMSEYLTYGGVPVNDRNVIRAYKRIAQPNSYRAETQLRNRPGRHPNRESVHYPVVRELFQVDRGRNGTHEAIMGTFDVMAGPRVLRGLAWDGTTVVEADAEVVEFSRLENTQATYKGAFEIRGPLREVQLRSASGGSASVGGNTIAQPIIQISGGQSVTRYRVNITDTYHGLSAHPVKIPLGLSEGNTIIFANGIPIPFAAAGGGLWVHVDAPPRGTVFLDVYSGGPISNSQTAGAFDADGLDLNASSNEHWVYTDEWNIARYAISAGGRWRPDKVVPHPQSRSWTFGMTSPFGEFALVDRNAGNRRWDLMDDADAAVLLSSVPISGTEGIEVLLYAGFEAEYISDGIDPANTTFVLAIYATNVGEPGRHVEGGISGTISLSFGDRSVSYTVDPNLTSDQNLALMEPLLNDLYGEGNWEQISTDPANGTRSYMLVGEFEAANVSAPLRQSSNLSHPNFTNAHGTSATFHQGHVGQEPSAEDLKPGLAALVAKYTRYDEPDWITFQREVLEGAMPNGTEMSFVIGGDLPSDVVGLSIGLEPASHSLDAFNWGELKLETGGSVSLTNTPTVTVSESLPARMLNGELINNANGHRMELVELLMDNTTLSIDTLHQQISVGSGPVYFRHWTWTEQYRWWPLNPGVANGWSAPGDWQVTVSWQDRWWL